MSSNQTTPTNSAQLFHRAKKVLAGGISHENRYVEPFPIYVNHAEGSRKWDVEGNEYVDFSMGSASLLLGHSHPAVVKALQDQAPLGTYFANCHPLEVEWAELVQTMFPSVERLRFTASGTEATMLALRLARAFTGKSKILRLEQHYHGWHDYVMYGMLAPYDQAASHGVPTALSELTIVCRQSPEAVEDILKSNADIAAIICEVSGPNWGSVPLVHEFLRSLRTLADKHEVVLIFDEVITGFRWSPGGIQEVVGVRPDLTTFAKILTGGLPGGAVGGREDIMRLMDPSFAFKGRRPGVTHKGTFNGCPIVAAAAVPALKLVCTGEAQKHANEIAARIRNGMQAVLGTHQVSGVAYGDASTFHVYFGSTDRDRGIAALDPAKIRGMPKEAVRGYQLGLRNRGVDLMSYMGGVTSLAHTEEDVDFFLGAFEETVRDLMKAGYIGRA
jgi:glutamate-1-semialdehyde 2,1-aminomutase